MSSSITTPLERVYLNNVIDTATNKVVEIARFLLSPCLNIPNIHLPPQKRLDLEKTLSWSSY